MMATASLNKILHTVIGWSPLNGGGAGPAKREPTFITDEVLEKYIDSKTMSTGASASTHSACMSLLELGGLDLADVFLSDDESEESEDEREDSEDDVDLADDCSIGTDDETHHDDMLHFLSPKLSRRRGAHSSAPSLPEGYLLQDMPMSPRAIIPRGKPRQTSEALRRFRAQLEGRVYNTTRALPHVHGRTSGATKTRSATATTNATTTADADHTAAAATSASTHPTGSLPCDAQHTSSSIAAHILHADTTKCTRMMTMQAGYDGMFYGDANADLDEQWEYSYTSETPSDTEADTETTATTTGTDTCTGVHVSTTTAVNAATTTSCSSGARNVLMTVDKPQLVALPPIAVAPGERAAVSSKGGGNGAGVPGNAATQHDAPEEDDEDAASSANFDVYLQSGTYLDLVDLELVDLQPRATSPTVAATVYEYCAQSWDGCFY